MNSIMVNKVKSITEATLLPISLVITLIGGTTLIATIHERTEANQVQIQKLEEKQDKYNDNLEKINSKLSRIEGRLKIYDDK